MHCTRSLRLLSAVLVFALMLCFVAPVKASDTQPVHTTLTAIVRMSASYESAPIGQLENGAELTVLDETREFYKIDCYEMNGYIAKSQVKEKDGKQYVDCAPESEETAVFTYEDHSTALQLRHSLYALARKQLGKPYIYGSTGPRGFDCSGLMFYLFSNHGITLHRTASQQLQDGIIVSAEAMQVGDLVFFRESWDSYPASHVGIYVGDGQIIHAGSGGMEYADLDKGYYAANFLCVRRVVDTNTAQLEQVAASVTASVATARRVR